MPAINNSDEDMSETERLLQNPVLDTDESSGGHAPSIRGPSDRFAFSLFCFHNVLLFPSQIFYLPVMLVQPIVSLLNMLKCSTLGIVSPVLHLQMPLVCQLPFAAFSASQRVPAAVTFSWHMPPQLDCAIGL
jgi:hypothetical protein